jgi:hypothetical protein
MEGLWEASFRGVAAFLHCKSDLSNLVGPLDTHSLRRTCRPASAPRSFRIWFGGCIDGDAGAGRHSSTADEWGPARTPAVRRRLHGV